MLPDIFAEDSLKWKLLSHIWASSDCLHLHSSFWIWIRSPPN